MRIDVDHYLVLGVPWTADAATVRAAYVALAKRYHPDVAAGNPELAAYNFRQIAAAYQTLSDPESRAHYDARVRAALDTVRASMSAVSPAYLPHAHAAARRRSITVVAVVVLVFLGLGSYLATRAVKEAASGAMLARTDTPGAARAPFRPQSNPLPLIDQPSQFGPSPRPTSTPIGGGAAGRSLTPRLSPAEVTDGQSVCVAADGARFTLVNRGGEPMVTYNGVQSVQASVQFFDRHLVVLTDIVPSDSIMIVIRRGRERGTLVYYVDPAGAIVQTIAAKCEGQAY